MSRRNNPSATKSVYDRDQPHATEHQPAQYRRSRSGRKGCDLRRNQERELSARDREFAPAWRCGSCCRRWPPSNSMADWGSRGRASDEIKSHGRNRTGEFQLFASAAPVFRVSYMLLPLFFCFVCFFFLLKKKGFPTPTLAKLHNCPQACSTPLDDWKAQLVNLNT